MEAACSQESVPLESLESLPGSWRVLLYYKYVAIPDPAGFLEEHRSLCESLELMGRILISHEGINGTVSGVAENTDRYQEALRAYPFMEGIAFKDDPAEGHVFPKLSIKLRPELVTLGLGKPEAGEGIEDIDPNEITGQHLSPAEFHAAMQEEDVILLDGRNDYESALGHFRNALCPDVPNFRDFPQWLRKHADKLRGKKKILTYCTGGIRCEKLSGFLLKEGFQNVFQLDGGIINYSHDPVTRGRDFDGQCYVFDQRVGVEVNHTETRSVVSLCRHCGAPSPRYRNCAWPECNEQVFLCEACEESFGKFCGEACREKAGRVAD